MLQSAKSNGVTPGKENHMNRKLRLIAGVLATLPFTFGGAQAATVYIPAGSAGEVLVVETETDTVVGRLSGLHEVHGLGGVPGGRYLVAGSYAESSPAEMPAVDKPAGVSQDAHAAHHGAAAKAEAKRALSILTVIDKSDGSTAARLEVPGAVHHVAVSPNGRYAVATHPNDDGISVLDLSDFSLRPLLRTGSFPNYAVFSPDGAKVYVSNSGNGTVSEVDTERWIVRRNLIAGESPEHLAVSQDGKQLYVANVEAGSVSVLALASGEVTRSFPVGGEIHGLDVSDDGGTLFVSGKEEDKLVAIDLASGKQRSASLGPAPYHLAVIPGTGKIYVSSRDEPKVWVVDQDSLSLRGSFAVSGIGHQMVVLP